MTGYMSLSKTLNLLRSLMEITLVLYTSQDFVEGKVLFSKNNLKAYLQIEDNIKVGSSISTFYRGIPCFVALHSMAFYTNWKQNAPPMQRLQIVLLLYFLYCGGLEPTPQYLWGMPIVGGHLVQLFRSRLQLIIAPAFIWFQKNLWFKLFHIHTLITYTEKKC